MHTPSFVAACALLCSSMCKPLQQCVPAFAAVYEILWSHCLPVEVALCMASSGVSGKHGSGCGRSHHGLRASASLLLLCLQTEATRHTASVLTSEAPHVMTLESLGSFSA
eukprot:359264-Chlamydomonas_euryale.AAC.10